MLKAYEDSDTALVGITVGDVQEEARGTLGRQLTVAEVAVVDGKLGYVSSDAWQTLIDAIEEIRERGGDK